MKQSLIIATSLLLLVQLAIFGYVVEETGATSILHVPGDFPTIQAAINSAELGDTIQVSAGTYYERVVVNQSVTLLGEGGGITILDGENRLETIVRVTADDVIVSGFELRKTGWAWARAGVEIYGADNCTVVDNLLNHTAHQIRVDMSRGTKVLGNVVTAPRDPYPQSAYGIRVENSVDCLVERNSVSNNIGGIHLENATRCVVTGNYVFQNGQGIRLYSPCQDNRIRGNIVFNNSYDGMIEAMPGNQTLVGNLFFHNNFINNSEPFVYKVEGCIWDNGDEGNYWTAYQGTDLNNDGVGDSPYHVGLEQDNYPLMGAYSEYEVQKGDAALKVGLICNSSVSGFQFNGTGLNFNLVGRNGTFGFCRVRVPVSLVDQPYQVFVNGTIVSYDLLAISNETHSHLYFAYELSTKEILIIPELITPILFSLFL
ncbi:MAG: right-handed parallel beta-helix repeat-containing protein, partial [Candidatus Bathyarchaeota archaeon]